MTTALIMAQGEQQRIGHLLDGPKQLIKIAGQETVIARTARLIREVDPSVIVTIIHHGGPRWLEEQARIACSVFTQPDPGGSVVGAIFNVRAFWDDRNVIFLGDVVYSKAAIRAMLERRNCFFGRLGPNSVTKKVFPELFGMAFDGYDNKAILAALADAGWRHHQDTKLWDLRARLEFPTVEISDYTDDLDTEEDYVKRLPILREAVAADVG